MGEDCMGNGGAAYQQAGRGSSPHPQTLSSSVSGAWLRAAEANSFLHQVRRLHHFQGHGHQKKCTPPSFKEGKREKNPHRLQHGLKDMKKAAERSAQQDGLPLGALDKQQKVPRGGTGTSFKKLLNGKHPQHNCDLINIKPLSIKARRPLRNRSAN